MIEPGDLDVDAPLVDESLDGLVARVASRTGLTNVRLVSAHGGVEHGHRPQLATTGWDDMPALAKLLEVDVAELRLRAHPLSADGTRRAFFGTSVPQAMLQTRIRRFSPAALLTSEHHRALWQLRLPFDVDTGEVLVDRCPDPECATVQRWRRTSGIRFCDHCATDLSTARTTSVDPAALIDARAAIGLIHPDPAKRAESRAALPHGLRDADPGLVLDLALRLMPVVDPSFTRGPGSRWWDNPPDRIAQALAAAWRLLPDFPASLRELMEERLRAATKQRPDGNGGASLRFVKLRKDPAVGPVVRAAVDELHELMSVDGPNGPAVRDGAMDVREAARTIGFGMMELVALRRAGALRTVALLKNSVIYPAFDRREILAVRSDIERRCDARRAATLLGMPTYGAEQLLAAERLAPLRHPFFAARYGRPQTTIPDVEALAADIASMSDPATPSAAPLERAVRAFGGSAKPWPALCAAILDRRLRIRLAPGDGPVLTRAFVDMGEMRALTAASWAPPTICGRGGLSRRDAGDILNLGPLQYCDALGRRGPLAGTVAIREVEALARERVAAVELAARFDASLRRVVAVLAAAGVERDSPAGYPRAAAETAVSLWADGNGSEGRPPGAHVATAKRPIHARRSATACRESRRPVDRVDAAGADARP